MNDRFEIQQIPSARNLGTSSIERLKTGWCVFLVPRNKRSSLPETKGKSGKVSCCPLQKTGACWRGIPCQRNQSLMAQQQQKSGKGGCHPQKTTAMLISLLLLYPGRTDVFVFVLGNMLDMTNTDGPTVGEIQGGVRRGEFRGEEVGFFTGRGSRCSGDVSRGH
ncbi:hypothetical protein BaRGS_00005420 [Batillaria attramentaria]|uniref:Uncharacterized protein n=1 Tax=Batillaria attramentaria TaxID=370345 RepID=A0ABD0LWT1_9CAEN